MHALHVSTLTDRVGHSPFPCFARILDASAKTWAPSYTRVPLPAPHFPEISTTGGLSARGRKSEARFTRYGVL